MKLRQIVLLLAFSILSTAASCNRGLPPNAAVEDKVAVRATQFGEALRVFNSKLPSMECPAGAEASLEKPCLGKSEAADVYQALERIGAAGKNELAAALTLVDNAKTAAERKTGLERVAAIAQQLSVDLDKVSIRPMNSTMREAFVTGLATASNILLTLTLF